ncbi:MAG TPA: hypothetical protein VFN53_07245 [Acidobacteriaceae bacterium]|nr:hypothetical protein [Acidobacteriaceae bacterium]
MSATGTAYTPTQLATFAKVSAAILGVEAEHCTLARAIPPPKMFNGGSVFPSDKLCYKSTDGLQSVYVGMSSAAAALKPFLAAGSGTTAFPVPDSTRGCLECSTVLLRNANHVVFPGGMGHCGETGARCTGSNSGNNFPLVKSHESGESWLFMVREISGDQAHQECA